MSVDRLINPDLLSDFFDAAPIACLTTWRVTLAEDELKVVAATLGYSSQAAAHCLA